MRALIVHNPRSGFGSDAIFQFERALLHAGDECVMRVLDDDFIAREACAGAADYDVVVVSGGDGTISSLLYELRGLPVPVCVFPSGTANLLCANIGNAPEPAALARACRIGKTARLDLGEISWETDAGEAHTCGFALMSGTGFDAQIMQAALPNKAIMGEAAYFAAALANPRPTLSHFTITVDGVTHERDGITCLVANTAMIQGDIEIVPDCRMDDGMLDIVVIEASTLVQLLPTAIAGVFDPAGKGLGRPQFKMFQAREAKITCTPSLGMQFDGELISNNSGVFGARVLPSCLDIIIDDFSNLA